MSRRATRGPTARQVQVARALCEWYLNLYHGTEQDIGTRDTFSSAALVGAFALAPGDWREGRGAALFRLLVATTLFQRRQDQQVLRILRGLPVQRVRELTTPATLLRLAALSQCEFAASQEVLLRDCDLTKDPQGLGCCSRNPSVSCALKQHTVWLKRYGHFGKVPTSAALMLRERGWRSLSHMFDELSRQHPDPGDLAQELQAALSSIWRVSEKIAAMYLSMLSNPDLGNAPPPWASIDWQRFVVVDSNTDLFLHSIGYRGPGTYAARRAMITGLAGRIDLSSIKNGVRANNPRLVQQAAYLFMSKANRRASGIDCWRLGVEACARCPSVLSARCPVRAV